MIRSSKAIDAHSVIDAVWIDKVRAVRADTVYDPETTLELYTIVRDA